MYLDTYQESVLARPLQKNSAKVVIRFLFQFDYKFSKKNWIIQELIKRLDIIW